MPGSAFRPPSPRTPTSAGCADRPAIYPGRPPQTTGGGTLLLGLEVLVAADLVQTVAVAPTLDNVLVLGLIVLIRTVLNFSLETEIEGVAPWKRAQLSGVGGIRQATASALKPGPGS